MSSLIGVALGFPEAGGRTGEATDFGGSKSGTRSGGLGVCERELCLFALFSVAGKALADVVQERRVFAGGAGDEVITIGSRSSSSDRTTFRLRLRSPGGCSGAFLGLDGAFGEENSPLSSSPLSDVGISITSVSGDESSGMSDGQWKNLTARNICTKSGNRLDCLG